MKSRQLTCIKHPVDVSPQRRWWFSDRTFARRERWGQFKFLLFRNRSVTRCRAFNLLGCLLIFPLLKTFNAVRTDQTNKLLLLTLDGVSKVSKSNFFRALILTKSSSSASFFTDLSQRWMTTHSSLLFFLMLKVAFLRGLGKRASSWL